MDQDESNCALWKSDNFLFFKWPVLRQHDDLYVKMNKIINGKYIRAWKNLKGLSSDKWDSADQQQKQRAENGASSSKIMTNQLQAI